MLNWAASNKLSLASNSLNTRNITKNTKTKEIIYKELSYKIVGLLFSLIKTLGGDYQEKYYQRGFEKLIYKEAIPFDRELFVKVEIDGEQIGKHFVDFVIDKRIVLEFKKGSFPRIGDIKQVLMYLKTLNLKLGILAYFSSNGVKIKRIINKDFREIL